MILTGKMIRAGNINCPVATDLLVEIKLAEIKLAEIQPALDTNCTERLGATAMRSRMRSSGWGGPPRQSPTADPGKDFSGVTAFEEVG
jgi:hypothetical protein